MMLEMTNLSAKVAGRPILDGLSLTVPAGEIHVLGRRPGYDVTGRSAG